MSILFHIAMKAPWEKVPKREEATSILQNIWRNTKGPQIIKSRETWTSVEYVDYDGGFYRIEANSVFIDCFDTSIVWGPFFHWRGQFLDDSETQKTLYEFYKSIAECIGTHEMIFFPDGQLPCGALWEEVFVANKGMESAKDWLEKRYPTPIGKFNSSGGIVLCTDSDEYVKDGYVLATF